MKVKIYKFPIAFSQRIDFLGILPSVWKLGKFFKNLDKKSISKLSVVAHTCNPST